MICHLCFHTWMSLVMLLELSKLFCSMFYVLICFHTMNTSSKLSILDFIANDVLSGADCSIIPSCTNVSDCSKQGICVDYDTCLCDDGWSGQECTEYTCEALGYCSGMVAVTSSYQFVILISFWTGSLVYWIS